MIRTLHIKIDPKSIKVDKQLDVIEHLISKNPAPKPQFGQWIDVKKDKGKKVSSKGPWKFVIKAFNFSIDLTPQPGQKLQDNDIGKVVTHIDFKYVKHEHGPGKEFVATLYRVDRPIYDGELVEEPGQDAEWELRPSFESLKIARKNRWNISLASVDQVELIKKLMMTATSLVKQAILRNQAQAYLKTSQILDEKLFFVFDTSPDGSVPVLPTTMDSLNLNRWLKTLSKYAGADITKIKERVKKNQELIFTGVKDREIQELIVICHAAALCALERNAGDHFSGRVSVTKPIIVNLSNKKNSTALAISTSNREISAPKGYYEKSLPVIQINYPLFKHDPEARKELLDTYLHEMSHLIVNEAYGRGMVRSHGKEFKEVMVVMGSRPVTHGIATAEEMRAARNRYQEAVGKKGPDFEPATIEYMEEIARNRPKRKLPPKKVEPEIKEVSEKDDFESDGDSDDMDFSQFDEG